MIVTKSGLPLLSRLDSCARLRLHGKIVVFLHTFQIVVVGCGRTNSDLLVRIRYELNAKTMVNQTEYR